MEYVQLYPMPVETLTVKLKPLTMQQRSCRISVLKHQLEKREKYFDGDEDIILIDVDEDEETDRLMTEEEKESWKTEELNQIMTELQQLKWKHIRCRKCHQLKLPEEYTRNKNVCNFCDQHRYEPRQCPVCKKYFRPLSGRHIYCSQQCRYEAKMTREKERIKEKPKGYGKRTNKIFGKCPQCNKIFEKVRSSQIYCSVKCAKKHYRSKQKVSYSDR